MTRYIATFALLRWSRTEPRYASVVPYLIFVTTPFGGYRGQSTEFVWSKDAVTGEQPQGTKNLGSRLNDFWLLLLT